MTNTHNTATKNSPLPLVIQIGFAGARKLADRSAFPQAAAEDVYAEAATQALLAVLKQLPQQLELGEARIFFCGISQIAVGADMAFAAALALHGSLHRVFLPQPLDGYLAAVGSSAPDFSAAEQDMAKALLAKSSVIQTRVVSDAADRRERFRETNIEIARVSDVVICLQRAGQTGKAGGTQELAELARRRNRPVITLEIGVGADGQPQITRLSDDEKAAPPKFQVPRLPEDLRQAGIDALPVQPMPSGKNYADALKNANSAQANQLRGGFKWADLIIVGGHVLATVLAVLALKVQHGLAYILVAELLLLGLGLGVHYRLHHSRSLGRWAACRLAAEVARSVQAMGKLPVYLQHFFTLPFPAEFRPLLRTLSVLHLHDTAHASSAPWQDARCAYVSERLIDPARKAQIPYHEHARRHAKTRLTWARGIFYGASISALLATALKLLTLALSVSASGAITAVLGALTILLPVIAVATLSLALAFDLEAKQHTASELLIFLNEQKALLMDAMSPGEVCRLVIETETRLLGETVNWYARRSFVGVA